MFCTINHYLETFLIKTSNGNTKMTTGPTDGDKAMLLGTIEGVDSGK